MYQKLNEISSDAQGAAEKPLEKYQKFYSTKPEKSEKLAEMLANDPEQVVACRKRLTELESLLKLDDNRCHISRDQRNFLRNMLEPYKNG